MLDGRQLADTGPVALDALGAQQIVGGGGDPAVVVVAEDDERFGVLVAGGDGQAVEGGESGGGGHGGGSPGVFVLAQVAGDVGGDEQLEVVGDRLAARGAGGGVAGAAGAAGVRVLGEAGALVDLVGAGGAVGVDTGDGHGRAGHRAGPFGSGSNRRTRPGGPAGEVQGCLGLRARSRPTRTWWHPAQPRVGWSGSGVRWTCSVVSVQSAQGRSVMRGEWTRRAAVATRSS